MLELEELRGGPGIDIPSLINTSAFRPATAEPLIDVQGREYKTFLFESTDQMPELIAEWLRFRTLTEKGTVKHERDKDRFKDVSEIVANFLTDSGGRDLYIAVSEGRLYGVAWIRPLKNDEFDYLLLEEGYKFLDGADLLNNDFAPRIDTIATREYGVANRKGLELRIGGAALRKHFVRHADSKGVVGIYAASDGTIQDLEDGVDETAGDHPIIAIAANSSEGWVILMSTPEPIDMHSAFPAPVETET